MTQALKDNIFMIILAIGYTAFVGYHYNNLRKYAGAKIKNYEHKSGIKTVGYIMIFFGIFYLILYGISKTKTPAQTITTVLFTYFVILIAYISIRDVGFYENGIYYSGKFINFENVESIERLNKKVIQVKLKKKRFSNGIYMSKITKDNEFIGAVRKKIKQNKKGKNKK